MILISNSFLPSIFISFCFKNFFKSLTFILSRLLFYKASFILDSKSSGFSSYLRLFTFYSDIFEFSETNSSSYALRFPVFGFGM